MRIWDIAPKKLCRNQLLGEHRELHAIWAILTEKKTGYSRHPETMRWRGKLRALYHVHEALVYEMRQRGYRHNSPLNIARAVGGEKQDEFIDPIEQQTVMLRKKKCGCAV
jgi:Pyrimidine dimer DNA glycosylase